MEIPKPIQATQIHNNNIEEWIFIGEEIKETPDDILAYFPEEYDKNTVWIEKYKHFNPWIVLQLIGYWKFHCQGGAEDEREWGAAFIAKAKMHAQLIDDFYSNYFEKDIPESKYDMFIRLYEEPNNVNGPLIWHWDNAWCRWGSNYVLLFEENLANERSIFIKKEDYAAFIKEIKLLGAKLFL